MAVLRVVAPPCGGCAVLQVPAVPLTLCSPPFLSSPPPPPSPSQQCNDVGLMAYLGTITKTCNTMNQFVNKFNVLYDRQGIGRRMRGLFF